MEIDVEEATTQQPETSSYHSLRTSISMEHICTGLSNTSTCRTALSMSQSLYDADRLRQFLQDTMVDELDDIITSANPAFSMHSALERVLSRTDSHPLEVIVPQEDDVVDREDEDLWCPPNTPVEGVADEAGSNNTTSCSTMGSLSPSVSRERIAGEVAEYLLIRGGYWRTNMSDSVRVEMPRAAAGPRSRSRSAHSHININRAATESTRGWLEEEQIRDCGQ